ncbi:hypothetical protein GQ42DRAFT_53802 [Ramicandelaber brevisporus]|nr:hypothetical protein GQ42DRAFT_53802 [Ramicandelaber brevisporus]
MLEPRASELWRFIAALLCFVLFFFLRFYPLAQSNTNRTKPNGMFHGAVLYALVAVQPHTRTYKHTQCMS